MTIFLETVLSDNILRNSLSDNIVRKTKTCFTQILSLKMVFLKILLLRTKSDNILILTLSLLATTLLSKQFGPSLDLDSNCLTLC